MSSNNLHQELAEGGIINENYYKLMGCNPSDSKEVIRDAYQRLAPQFHPDRTRNPADMVSVAIYTRLLQANIVLSDEISRGLYDINQGFKSDTREERRRITSLKREQAMSIMTKCNATLKQSVDFEAARDGLVLQQALYGDISVDPERHPDYSDFSSTRSIDVTTVLQLEVQESMLEKNAGCSMAWLDGFFDPNDGRVNNKLYIKYKFRGALHEVVFDDTDAILLPLEDHLLDDSDLEYNAGAETDCELSDSEDNISYRKKKITRTARSQLRDIKCVLKDDEVVKAARRRKLFATMGMSVLTSVIYFAHRWNLINIANFSPIRLLLSLFMKNDTPKISLNLDPQPVVAMN